jgi:hypothetical protein
VIWVKKIGPSVFLAPELVLIKVGTSSGAKKGSYLSFITDIMHLWCVLNPCIRDKKNNYYEENNSI